MVTSLNEMDISRDGSCVAVGGINGYLYLLNSEGDVIIEEDVAGHLGGGVNSVTIAPDCSYLVIGVRDMIKYYDIS